MEASLPSDTYMHIDLAGVSIFDAGGDNAVPRHGPIFSALGKIAFGFHDKPNQPFGQDSLAKLASYNRVWESPEKGIESLLIKETPNAVVRRFLKEVASRSDYPPVGAYDATAADGAVAELAIKVLKARKGDAHGYAAVLMAQCQDANELPATIRGILEAIHKTLGGIPDDPLADEFEALIG
jgi:putative ATP-dependent endonuclease of OLD family